MKIKKPSLKGMKNTGYLGHFAQDKFIAQGHNFSGKAPYREKPGVAFITEDKPRSGPDNPNTEEYGPADERGSADYQRRAALDAEVKAIADRQRAKMKLARMAQAKSQPKAASKKASSYLEAEVNKREEERRRIAESMNEPGLSYRRFRR